MIEYNLSEQLESPPDGEFSVRVIGVGGAGANVLDRMALEGSDEADLLTLNTDVRALSSSVSSNKVQLGKTLLKGMGAGGDPELGKQGALEAVDEIRGSLKGYKMSFVCVGLGGGTGSGAAPEVCRVAKEEGVFLVVFATLPFQFEGKRRMEQALEALDRIGQYANAVVTFDNDRMGELIVPKEGVQAAFAAADKIISQAIRATMKIVSHPGIIRIGMDEILSALNADNSRCLFGFGVAKGDNRAQEALEQALKSPLLDKGKMLNESKNVLVHVGGGDSMTLFEIELVMQELSKHIDDSKTQILFGTGTDKKLGGNLTVTIISSLSGPGGQRHQAPAESPGMNQQPETSAPRLGSPLTAPLSPPPAPAPEPEKTVEPVAAAEPVSAEESVKSDEPESSAPETVEPEVTDAPVSAPAAETEIEKIEEDVPPLLVEEGETIESLTEEPASETVAEEEASEPEEEKDSEPVAEEPAAEESEPEPVAVEEPESGAEEEPKLEAEFESVIEPAPETEAPRKPKPPVDLQPVRKTAVVPPEKLRKPPIEVAPPRKKPVLNIPAASADDHEDEEVDSIGKMLLQGRDGTGLAQDAPLGDEDPTIPVAPAAAGDDGEAVVAQTGDAQKISLSRLVPGSPPSADDVTLGALPANTDSEDGQEGLPEVPELGEGMLSGDTPDLDDAAAQHQQMLQLEPLSKGRFAKTEPTIVDGEDMDVPTFLRKRRK